jgi:hypothetical protein
MIIKSPDLNSSEAAPSRVQKPGACPLAGCGETFFQPCIVIPAETGIPSFQCFLDSRFRGSDGFVGFFRILSGSRLFPRIKICPQNSTKWLLKAGIGINGASSPVLSFILFFFHGIQ